MTKKELCLGLLKAESEDEVISILRDNNLWDDNSLWLNYGGIENNWGIIGNQQSKPESALVEKLVNSVDAILMRECLCNGINPVSKKAPGTISKAVEKFFGVKNGNLAILSSRRRTEIANEIGLIATGSRSNPNYIVFDRGEGQLAEDFGNTFLSLNKSNKLRIPFVQGTYNQGGTGVIRFCGKNHLQLLISKRHPKLVSTTPNKWGFTVIRRQSPTEGVKHSVFTCLAPNKRILEFQEEELKLLFGDSKNQSIEPLTWGTVIKLFEYEMTGLKTNILFDLYNKIALLLPKVGLPIRFYERRDYEGHSFESTMAGLSVRLDEDTRENLEHNFPISSQFYIDKQAYRYKIYVFKKGSSEKYRKNEGIIFSVNGQAQGFLRTTFFKRKSINFDYLADSILVTVDCSDLEKITREDLFMNSRDRLTDGLLRSQIEKELEEIIGSNQGLKRLNNKRRDLSSKDKLANSKPMKEILENIISKSPSLSALFKQGGDFANPFKPESVGEIDDFKGKKFPTYFNLLKGEKGKECYLEQRFRVQFKSDVEDSYINREISPGTFNLEINGKPSDAYTLNPWEGIYTLNVVLPDFVKVGDVIVGKVVVSDETQINPFTCKFTRSVNEARKNKRGGGGGKRKKRNKSQFALPEIMEIYESEWAQYSFDEFSGLCVMSDGQGGYDYYVNMDNKYLFHEIKKRNKEGESILLKGKFKFAMALIGMALMKDREILEKQGVFEEQTDIGELVKFVTQAIAPLVLPMIDSLSRLAM